MGEYAHAMKQANSQAHHGSGGIRGARHLSAIFKSTTLNAARWTIACGAQHRCAYAKTTRSNRKIFPGVRRRAGPARHDRRRRRWPRVSRRGRCRAVHAGCPRHRLCADRRVRGVHRLEHRRICFFGAVRRLAVPFDGQPGLRGARDDRLQHRDPVPQRCQALAHNRMALPEDLPDRWLSRRLLASISCCIFQARLTGP